MSNSPFEQHLEITTDNTKAVDALAEVCELSRQQIKAVMQKGAVWQTRGKHTQRLRRASKTLKAGDQLHLYYNPQVLQQEPTPAQLIADEGAYSVWFKPYGMYSQGTKWGDHCAIDRWVEQHLQPERPAFVVHRLDRAATGLILIAHQKRSAAALSQLFEQRQLTKAYRVLVRGQYADQPCTYNTPIDGRPAVSHARLIAFNADKQQSLLEVTIETGRKHQIRRHLAAAGFPVMGDRLHGTDEKDGGVDLQLCAYRLEFTCPFSSEKRCYQLPDALSPLL